MNTIGKFFLFDCTGAIGECHHTLPSLSGVAAGNGYHGVVELNLASGDTMLYPFFGKRLGALIAEVYANWPGAELAKGDIKSLELPDHSSLDDEALKQFETQIALNSLERTLEARHVPSCDPVLVPPGWGLYPIYPGPTEPIACLRVIHHGKRVSELTHELDDLGAIDRWLVKLADHPIDPAPRHVISVFLACHKRFIQSLAPSPVEFDLMSGSPFKTPCVQNGALRQGDEWAIEHTPVEYPGNA